MRIDRTVFFREYRKTFDRLDATRRRVQAIERILAFIESDPYIRQSIGWIAYVLATIQHETAGTFEPVREYGRGRGRRYGVAVDVQLGDGRIVRRTYYGRGYIQLTWAANYKRIGRELGIGDRLAADPDLALDPRLSWAILSVGMRRGLFTGKKLSDYIDGDRGRFVAARRIVNGLDCAQLIASRARRFLAILQAENVAQTTPDKR